MAASVKLTDIIFGILNNAANRFRWTVGNETGEFKLKRDNGQEVINVDAAGRVSFPQIPKSFTANGHCELQNGLILQWVVRTTGNMGVNSQEAANGTWPIPFPTAVLHSWGSAKRTLTSGAAHYQPDTNTTRTNWSAVATCQIAGQFDTVLFAIGH